MSPNHKFPSSYRLKSRKKIEELFRSSESLLSFPLLLKYKISGCNEETLSPQVAFSIAKKNFKKAIERNRIKRLMKEAYRLQWQDQLQSISSIKNSQLTLIIIYLDKVCLPYSEIHDSMLKALKKLDSNLRRS